MGRNRGQYFPLVKQGPHWVCHECYRMAAHADQLVHLHGCQQVCRIDACPDHYPNGSPSLYVSPRNSRG